MCFSLGHVSCEAPSGEVAIDATVVTESEAPEVDFRLRLLDTTGAYGREGGDDDVYQRQAICGAHFGEVRVQGRSFGHCV